MNQNITYSFRCNWIFVKIEISDGSKIASECSLPHSALQAGRSGAATILILRSTWDIRLYLYSTKPKLQWRPSYPKYDWVRQATFSNFVESHDDVTWLKFYPKLMIGDRIFHLTNDVICDLRKRYKYDADRWVRGNNIDKRTAHRHHNYSPTMYYSD